MISETVKLLQDNKIRPSYARIRILDYLKQHKTHPAAEEIYSSLVMDIPTLSRTTVYNTLSLLSQNNILKLITVGESEKRYDGSTNDHGHFICKECSVIYDFSIDTDKIGSEEPKDFTVDEKNVYLRGTCKKCLNKNISHGGKYE
jgi:Fe2+ or Zn2+ uptake regulation protein